MPLQGFPAKCLVFFIKILVAIHDVLTLPYYLILDKPWRKWQQDRIIWAKLEDENDPYSCYVRQVYDQDTDRDIETMDQLFDYSVKIHGERKCFGVREVLGEEEEAAKTGKVFKKLSLGDYKWLTYSEIDKKVDYIGKGLLAIGVKSHTRVALFAETRVEWILTAQALFRINAPLVTLYATLGEDGLVHCINETEINYIVTSAEQLPKLKSILPKLPNLTHIVCMEDLIKPTKIDFSFDMKFMLFSELVQLGKENLSASFTPPSPDDLAILMYTSGSTGVPKGVLITHRNVLTCSKGVDSILRKTTFDHGVPDRYVAYLPLAHILELALECHLLSYGVQIGFSSPQTLTDFSTAIKKGEKGDLTVLKPTLMVTVPLMLDRIRNSILVLAGKEGTFTRLMFDFAIDYKAAWTERGFKTPKLNRNLLYTYEDFMGGELRVMMCGSAPLSQDTQSFISCCLNVPVLQGYGLTETAACATVMSLEDSSYGRVGAPLATCKLRLVDWEEGKYFVTDKPHPRGEIVIGGDSLTLGYFKNVQQTMESFKIEGGERWFYTGDIGEVFPNGTLKIIDRKKDLIKLQFGEYVALGKVEAELKTSPLVENICIFGNMQQNYLVALVIPNQYHLKVLAKDMGKENLSFAEMCLDAEIIQSVEEKLIEHAKKCHLYGCEIPKKISLCSDDWNPESGLVTAAFKVRRKYIETHYQDIIQNMYSQKLQNGFYCR